MRIPSSIREEIYDSRKPRVRKQPRFDRSFVSFELGMNCSHMLQFWLKDKMEFCITFVYLFYHFSNFDQANRLNEQSILIELYVCIVELYYKFSCNRKIDRKLKPKTVSLYVSSVTRMSNRSKVMNI